MAIREEARGKQKNFIAEQKDKMLAKKILAITEVGGRQEAAL